MIPLVVFGWKIAPQGGTDVAAANESQAGDFIKSLYFIVDKNVNAARFSKFLNWVNLIFLGVFASGICFTIWSKACQIIGTVKVSCGLYLIPIVTTAFAFFVLDERVTLLSAAGTAITIAGLFLSERK
jgi:drug/metabolite transporter (DMT)-like permease